MRVGGRNRLMHWTGTIDPVQAGQERPAGSDTPGRGGDRAGGVVAIAGEGRIGAIETDVLPLERRTRLFRAALPGAAGPDRDQRHELAPVRWSRPGPRRRAGDRRGPARSGRRGSHDRDARGARLRQLVADAPEPERTGRVARWLTDRVQRLARGVARGRLGRPADSPGRDARGLTGPSAARRPRPPRRPGRLAYSARRPDRQQSRSERGSDRAFGRPQGVPPATRRPVRRRRSTRGPPSSCATWRSVAASSGS